MKNKSYWSYNLPLQVWPEYADPNDNNSPIIGTRILNYMPRKESCVECRLDSLLNYQQTREEFFETAALHFENMARLFREAVKDPKMTIYYHDEGMNKENLTTK